MTHNYGNGPHNIRNYARNLFSWPDVAFLSTRGNGDPRRMETRECIAHMVRRIVTLYENAVGTLAPVDFSPVHDIYRPTLPEHVRQGMDAVLSHQGIFSIHSALTRTVVVKDLHHSGRFLVDIAPYHMPREVQFVYSDFDGAVFRAPLPIDLLPEESFCIFRDWFTRRAGVYIDYRLVIDFFAELQGQAETYGQMLRVCPMLEWLLDDDTKEAWSKRKAKSRLNQGIKTEIEEGNATFIAGSDKQRVFGGILTKWLMLPSADQARPHTRHTFM